MKLNMDRFEECLGKIAARGKINPAEAKAILQEVANRAEGMRASGQKDPFVSAAAELADKVTNAAKKKKTDALANLYARQHVLDVVDRNGGVRNAIETLRSLLHGTYKSSLDSVQSMSRGLANTWQGVLNWQLRAAGVEKAAITGAMDRDLAIELGKLSGWTDKSSGNIQAEAAAKAIHPILNTIKDRMNALGAHIATALDYVAKTRHDPYKIRRAAGSSAASLDEAFAAWWSFTRGLLHEKTFAGVVPTADQTMEAARTAFGRNVFDALITGIHMTTKGDRDEGFVPYAFEGTRNLARKASHDRTLFWKDPESWHDYVSKFGDQTSITDGVMRSISQGARSIALMDKFGTNPMANLRLIMRSIEEKYRGDADAVKKFSNKKQAVENVMAYLDGSANIPENFDWARIGQDIRTAYATFDLGGVGITHGTSIWVTVPSELRHHGISRLEAVGQVAASLVKGRGDAERQEILADLGAYADGLVRDVNANWQPDTPWPGRLSGMANTYMKYTGIHYVFDRTDAAVRSMLSHNLARNMSKTFADLNPLLQKMLSSYGINEPEWDLLRTATGLKVENGRAYLTPHDAMNVDPTGSLTDKLSGYYSDTAAHSRVTPGARERANSWLGGGTRRGSGAGEALRFLAQFKMWPVAAFDQLLRREIYMNTSAKTAAWGLGSMMALSAAAGYLRMSINDLALGNPLRNPLEPKTLLAGLAQGGGMGILGDFLFGEAMRSRFGAGLIGTLGGPLVSDADSLIHIYNQWLNGRADWNEIARFGVRHIPYANLVYVKGALDYLVLYHLYEAASPGWWERSNRRLQKETGRTMTGYQPGEGVPFGLPYLYMTTPGGATSGLFGGSNG